jgi:hypothetical protein
MSLTDKVKEQAEHAVGIAKQGVSQGQAKFEELQAKRQSQALFRRLGEAYYAEQRQGASAEAVEAALAALDQHVAAQSEKDAETPATGSIEVGAAAETSGSAASGDGPAADNGQ